MYSLQKIYFNQIRKYIEDKQIRQEKKRMLFQVIQTIDK